MKYLIALGAAVLTVTGTAQAQTKCQTETMALCMAQEAGKPDSTRSGVSAREFCAATAIVECANQD